METKGFYTHHKKRVEREPLSLFVRFGNKMKIDDKGLLERSILSIHPDITSVFFPRQNVPKFCYVSCTNPEARTKVSKSLKNYNGEIGKLFPRLPNKCELDTDEIKEMKKAKQRRRNNKKASSIRVNLTTLVLNNITKELDNALIQKAVPACSTLNRLSDTTCYLTFDNINDALQAYEHLSKQKKIGRHHIRAKFINSSKPKTSRRRRRPRKKHTSTQESSSSDSEQETASQDKERSEEEDSESASTSESDSD